MCVFVLYLLGSPPCSCPIEVYRALIFRVPIPWFRWANEVFESLWFDSKDTERTDLTNCSHSEILSLHPRGTGTHRESLCEVRWTGQADRFPPVPSVPLTLDFLYLSCFICETGIIMTLSAGRGWGNHLVGCLGQCKTSETVSRLVWGGDKRKRRRVRGWNPVGRILA